MESNAKQTLIIRADANAKSGSGHIMRMFALAQSWQQTGGIVIFITNCKIPALLEKLKHLAIKKNSFEVIQVTNSYPQQLDLKITEVALNSFPDSWCVVDGYHFDSDFYGAIRKNDNKVLAVDDTIRLPFYDADAILNQNIYAEKLDYNCPKDTILLLGKDFTMLRQEFLKWQDKTCKTSEVANKILITMGGSDIHNQTAKAIQAIEKLEFANLEVRAVVGSSNPHLAKLEKTAEDSAVQIEIIENAENMSEIMNWSDIAISAAGSTCWELCFMQVPAVLIITADNQNIVAKGLSKAGFAINLGWFENVSVEDLTQTLSQLLPDKPRREKMSKIGREIIDGKGTMRIIDILRS